VSELVFRKDRKRKKEKRGEEKREEKRGVYSHLLPLNPVVHMHIDCKAYAESERAAT